MELNQHVQERSYETKFMDKLRMEIPERYKTDDDVNGFVQLNLDATRILKHCKKKHIRSVHIITNIRQL